MIDLRVLNAVDNRLEYQIIATITGLDTEIGNRWSSSSCRRSMSLKVQV